MTLSDKHRELIKSLEGRKCRDRAIYDEDFEDGSVYQQFENLEYYG